ncbi:unnamed protein product [Allacma fusca]|uniref:Small ribosomal subunit protein uS5m n=1 Tax=Allacma fusca TaxID=39272 RepID=A0A8J2IXV8_9HEXA|nr:unnamed protein product [Allacma fusca]
MLRCLRSNTAVLQHLKFNFERSNFQQLAQLSNSSIARRPYIEQCSNKNNGILLLAANTVLTNLTRSNTSFFNKVSAEQLWKGVTTVSNAGKKRGRGMGVNKKMTKDLNRGQVIGVGKANIQWPGLNAPIIRGKEVIRQQQLPPDPERESKLIKMRDTMGRFKPLRLSPLERGWSGYRMGGRSCGPPDPIGQDAFEGFDTRVMEMKTVTTLDGNLGKIRTFSCCTITGNKNGLAGVGLGKAGDGRSAMKRSKNRAGQKLVYIQRYNGHTVMHDFFSQFGQTKIFVYKKHEGYGLVCHRALKTICELVGIKDIYAKVEGSMNMQHLIKAFMLGLLSQKTHDELANKKMLYLVEQREENEMFPTVVGIPDVCRTKEEVKPEEILDFSLTGFDERLPLRRRLYQPFYTKLPGWQYHLLKTEFRRNHPKKRVQLLAEYGGTKQHARSHLTKEYPETDSFYPALLHRKAIAVRQAESE